MEKYFCSCFNIVLNVKLGEIREVIGKNLIQLEEKVKCCDPFFSGTLLDVKLAISGIEVVSSHLAEVLALIWSASNAEIFLHNQ